MNTPLRFAAALASAIVATAIPASAQILAVWNFDGLGPFGVNGAAGNTLDNLAATSVAAGVTAEMDFGPGTIVGIPATDTLRMRGWGSMTPADAVSTGDYYAFVLTSAVPVDVTQVDIYYAPTAVLDATKFLHFELRSSLDGFATVLDTHTDTTSATLQFQTASFEAGTAVQDVTSVELRLFVSGGPLNTATSPHIRFGTAGDGLGDVVLYAGPVPEAAAFPLLAGVMVLAGVAVRRRR